MSDPLDAVRRLRPNETPDPELLEREKRKLMRTIESAQVQQGQQGQSDVTSPPADRPHVIPQMPYGDIEAAVQWLTRVFGFREAEGSRVKGADGLVHAEVEVGNGRIMLGTAGGHGATSPAMGGSLSMLLSVYVEDIDSHYRRAVESGATICAELEDKFFGDRVYECLDLEGHRWSFHQHTGRQWEFSEE
jgi:uncharacterized glyoxalase superfamily protein PhnB